MDGFLRHNPAIKTLISEPLDRKRLKGTTTAIIKDFFYLLNVPEVAKILPCNRYNADEVGFRQGIGSNSLVVGESTMTKTYKAQPGKRGSQTALVCISATGRYLPP